MIRPARLAVVLVALIAGAGSAHAQYFGRNKVQYEKFDWRILRTDHFNLFFYPSESLKVHDAGSMAERWYTRHSDSFRHTFDRKSIVLYADHPDFEQTNVIGEQPEEGTGGVTEGMRTRVIMPFTGSYADDDHVLGHELVHVFQYNIAETSGGGLARLNMLPLWLIEGMAEYFSLGRDDPLTAMWMRDAVLRDKFPTIKQLTTDPRFFPYRYGQALWAYVGGRWGDRAVVDVYRAALRLGWDQALVRVLGESSDSLSKDWIAANKALYQPMMADRQKPKELSDVVIGLSKRGGDMNLAPTLSPDGRFVAFFARRGLFTIDLFVADAITGRVIKKLGGPTSDPHFDAISFINSAGAWSPDGEQFAFVVYAQGNNEIAILRTRDGNVESSIRIPGVGAVTSVAWSPDGKTLAFSGVNGGVSDIYTMEIATKAVKQLTNDRFADLQPAFSPDGRTIAFATDRGPITNFESFTYSALQIGMVPVDGGSVRVLNLFARGKHINPQYSPDGRDVFFVSDQDGFPDIYRAPIDGSAGIQRITRVATGVSGITTISPAISVAPRTGRLLYSLFQEQGYSVHGLDSARTHGPLVDATLKTQVASILPPGDVAGRATVTSYLKDPLTGLPQVADFRTVSYKPSFSLDALGQPSLGVASGPFGTGVAGGISGLFGDQLSDQQIVAAIQANGTVKDIGGQVVYQNLKNRLNWSVGAEHIPYLTGGVLISGGQTQAGIDSIKYEQILQRIFVDQVQATAAYPFSTTRRVEIGASLTRLGFSQQRDILTVLGNQVVDRTIQTDAGPPPIFYAQPTIALVGDNSFSAFVGPVAGGRWRAEYSPTMGKITFQTALLDYRKYMFMRPVTFAIRGMHYGRYGKDADNYNQLSPIYVGEETLIRGYGYGSIDVTECQTGGASSTTCPVFDRMLGSRIGVFNAEMRIPLFGTGEFGLIDFPVFPTEISPFFDAGIAYTGDQPPSLRWSTSPSDATPASCASRNAAAAQFLNCVERVPVFSTGVSARINVLGYMVVEAYVAHPFQRPKKNWVFGFQLAPGW
ncbi:MAG: peptidase dipeptidylpeptidase domain protein [Gemmatimonadetes bacterium]|nr:peptidase dipeptidylpeptidase domain protein [Gemmatimonadota bacterium]